MNVISLKEYAKNRNITYEAVRQQVVRYADELKEHLIKDGRQQFLNEEAVAFLDERRAKNPVVVQQADKDAELEELRQARDNLLLKVTAQADKIAELSEWKAENALLLAEAKHQQALLQSAEARAEQAEGALDLAVGEKLDLQAKLEEAEERARAAEAAAERLKNRGFFARIFNLKE